MQLTIKSAAIFNLLNVMDLLLNAAEVLQYLETAYGVPLDGPEDRESLAGQNSDLELGTEAAQALPDHSDPPRSPARLGALIQHLMPPRLFLCNVASEVVLTTAIEPTGHNLTSCCRCWCMCSS